MSEKRVRRRIDSTSEFIDDLFETLSNEYPGGVEKFWKEFRMEKYRRSPIFKIPNEVFLYLMEFINFLDYPLVNIFLVNKTWYETLYNSFYFWRKTIKNYWGEKIDFKDKSNEEIRDYAMLRIKATIESERREREKHFNTFYSDLRSLNISHWNEIFRHSHLDKSKFTVLKYFNGSGYPDCGSCGHNEERMEYFLWDLYSLEYMRIKYFYSSGYGYDTTDMRMEIDVNGEKILCGSYIKNPWRLTDKVDEIKVVGKKIFEYHEKFKKFVDERKEEQKKKKEKKRRKRRMDNEGSNNDQQELKEKVEEWVDILFQKSFLGSLTSICEYFEEDLVYVNVDKITSEEKMVKKKKKKKGAKKKKKTKKKKKRK